VIFSSDKKLMGVLVNRKITTVIAWIVAALIVALNVFLLYETIWGGG
jgi:manganese transport protein